MVQAANCTYILIHNLRCNEFAPERWYVPSLWFAPNNTFKSRSKSNCFYGAISYDKSFYSIFPDDQKIPES